MHFGCIPITKSNRGFALAFLAVLVLTALLFLARLGERALWSEEVRWAEIPREMQLNSDYLWPTINGKTYYDKPLGSYWLVLLASLIGGSVDETAARLPCALSGLLGVVLVMLMARRLFDDRTAILSGVILASSFSFVFFSRTASTDVETVTGVLAALWLFLRNEERPDGWWVLGLWLIMALTSLTKGLLGFVLPVLVIGLYCSLPATTDSVRSQGWFRALVARNRWFFNRKSLFAVPLGVLLYLLPFLLSYGVAHSAEGLAMVYRENIRRFYDPVNHRGPIYLYAGVIFLLLAPWSPLLPAALVRAHQRCRMVDASGRGNRFALVYFWGLFLFFTLSSSRRSYYLLPILPAGAILIARPLAEAELSWKGIASRLLIAGYVLIALVSVLSAVVLLPASSLLPAPWDTLPALPNRPLFVLAWTAALVGIVLAVRRFTRGRIALSLSLIAVSFLAYLFLCALPGMEAYRTRKQFASEVTRQLDSSPGPLALCRNREIVFYLGQRDSLPEYQTEESLVDGLRHQKVRWLIVRRQDLESLRMARFREVIACERSFSWESREQRKHKLILLDLCAAP